jgi:hypothetical protein
MRPYEGSAVRREGVADADGVDLRHAGRSFGWREPGDLRGLGGGVGGAVFGVQRKTRATTPRVMFLYTPIRRSGRALTPVSS